MKKHQIGSTVLCLLCSLLVTACSGQRDTTLQRNPKEVVENDGIRLEVYDFENFHPFLHRKDDTLYVVNVWATWCAPCIKELPYFEQIGQEYREKPIKVLLVSLDFPDKIVLQVIPFIRKKELQSEVILLDAPDANAWIPEVDPEWSGAIPATVIYDRGNRKFYEQSFTLEQLREAVESF